MTTITASRIKEALFLRDMKQTDLAEKTGLGRSAISQYLSGKVNPKQDKIYLIAKALMVDELWLMGLSDTYKQKTNDFIALENIKNPIPTKQVQDFQEQKLLSTFRNLDMEDKNKILTYVKDLSENKKYNAQCLQIENNDNHKLA